MTVASLPLGAPVTTSDLYSALPGLDTAPYYQGPEYSVSHPSSHSAAPGPVYPGPGPGSPVFHTKSLPSPGRQRTKARSNAGKPSTAWRVETNTVIAH